GDQQVAQTDVGEGSADHHFVITATRSVRVEVPWLHAEVHQVVTRGRVLLDRARWRDVVRRHRVTQQGQHAGTPDVRERFGVAGHAVEVRRAAHVRRLVVPGE